MHMYYELHKDLDDMIITIELIRDGNKDKHSIMTYHKGKTIDAKVLPRNITATYIANKLRNGYRIVDTWR